MRTNKFEPKDFIAMITLAASYTLLAFGIDSWVTSTITLVLGYYFGRRKDLEDKIKQNEQR